MHDVSVERWRIEQFQRMGFTGSAAVLLHEWRTDLHQAADLIGSGCPPHTAMRILRPLEDTPPEDAIPVVDRIAAYSA